jgi:hypothetical protein
VNEQRRVDADHEVNFPPHVAQLWLNIGNQILWEQLARIDSFTVGEC